MPIYEYRCVEGHQYERAEGFDAPSEHTCPRCGGRSRRQISLPAVIFKGSGFYSTDNRKGYASGGNGASVSSPSSSKETDTADTADESKAEATAAE